MNAFETGRARLTFALFASAIFFGGAAASLADEVQLADGTKLTGRVTKEDAGEVTLLTYKDGPVVLPAAKVKSVAKKPSLYDSYDKKAKESEDTAGGHLRLGEWCKGQGLLFQAKEEWTKTLELDKENEKAHKALGHEKVSGEWKTHDEVMKAKGLELVEGQWLKPKDAERLRATLHPKIALVLVATTSFETDKEFLQSWAERAKAASKYMWRLTEGQMYVKEITVTDKGGQADFLIINKDKMKIREGVYAEAEQTFVRAPGLILEYTFFHELIHYRYKRADHCTACKQCIMSSDPSADAICDDADHKSPPATSCWAAIRKQEGGNLKPLAHAPNTPLEPVPETTVIINKK